MVWIGLKSAKTHTLLIHASSGGKDNSSSLSWVMECCKGRLDWNWALLFRGVQTDGEEDSCCLYKRSVYTFQQANSSKGSRHWGKKGFASSRSDQSWHLVRDGALSPVIWASDDCPLPTAPSACISWLCYDATAARLRTSKEDGRESGGKRACLLVCLFPELRTKMNVFVPTTFSRACRVEGPSKASCRAVSWKVHPCCNWLCHSCQGGHLAAPHAFVPQLPFEIHQLQ